MVLPTTNSLSRNRSRSSLLKRLPITTLLRQLIVVGIITWCLLLLYWSYKFNALPDPGLVDMAKMKNLAVRGKAQTPLDLNTTEIWFTGTVRTIDNSSAPTALLVMLKCVTRQKKLVGLTWLQGYPTSNYMEQGQLLQHPIGHMWRPSVHVQDFSSGRRYLATVAPDFDPLRPTYFQVDYDGNPAFFRIFERSFDHWQAEVTCPQALDKTAYADVDKERLRFWMVTQAPRPDWMKHQQAVAMLDAFKHSLKSFVEHHLGLGFTGVLVYAMLTVQHHLRRDETIKQWVDADKLRFVLWPPHSVVVTDDKGSGNDDVMLYHHALLSFEGTRTYMAISSVEEWLFISPEGNGKIPPIKYLLCSCNKRCDPEDYAYSYVVPRADQAEQWYWQGHLVLTRGAASLFSMYDVIKPAWITERLEGNCAYWGKPLA